LSGIASLAPECFCCTCRRSFFGPPIPLLHTGHRCLKSPVCMRMCSVKLSCSK
jgi:hypothetical protein